MKKYAQLYFLIFSLFTLFSCGEGGSTGRQKAAGNGGEIFVFMDSAKWKSELGTQLREVFSAPLNGVMPAEQIFTLRRIDPVKINKLLKSHKNVLFVTSFDDQSESSRKLQSYFPTEAKEKIKLDSNFFMIPKRDLYASEQMVLHLFGKNDEQLIANLKKNKLKLLDIYNKIETERTANKVLKSVNQDLMTDLQNMHQINMKVLTGYQLVTSEQEVDKKSGFAWYRFPEAVLDKDIFIAYKPYISEKQFDKDSIIAWRNQICQKYLHEDPEKENTYLITEMAEPPVSQSIQFKGEYALETRGLWKTKNISMGGSFISYAFTDNKGRLYYIEGFVYAPDRNKREIIREFEAILGSFEKVL